MHIPFWPTYYTAWTGADPDKGDGEDGTIVGDRGDKNNNSHDDSNDNEGSDEDEDNEDDKDDKDDKDDEDKDDGSIHTTVLANVSLVKMIGTYPKPINFSTLICLTM